MICTTKIVRSFTIFLITISLAGCSYTRKEKIIRGKELNSKKPNKQIKYMSNLEALEYVQYYEELGQRELIIAIYNKIISSEKNPEIVARYMLKLAELYQKEGSLDEAKKYYNKIITIYPGSDVIETTRYNEILAYFSSQLAPIKDQSGTHFTIKLGKEFLKDFPRSLHAKDVASMIASSYKKLLISDLLIIEFYIHKFEIEELEPSIDAAENRLKYVFEQLIPQMLTYIPKIKSLLDTISTNQDDGRDFKNESSNETELSLTARLAKVNRKVDLIKNYINREVATTISSNERKVHPRDRF